MAAIFGGVAFHSLCRGCPVRILQAWILEQRPSIKSHENTDMWVPLKAKKRVRGSNGWKNHRCISVNHLRSGFATVERDLVVGVRRYSILRILCGEILEREMTFSFIFSFKVPFPTCGRLTLNASDKLCYSYSGRDATWN